MQIDVSRRIGAPADRVWGMITDLANSQRVMTAIESVDLLGGPEEFGVGTRWRETRMMFGKWATEEMTVSVLDSGRSYTVVTESSGAKYASTLAVVPEGYAACPLTMTLHSRHHHHRYRSGQGLTTAVPSRPRVCRRGVGTPNSLPRKNQPWMMTIMGRPACRMVVHQTRRCAVVESKWSLWSQG